MARALIDAQFPQLRPVRVEPLASGWDNTAFLVNGDTVFRFPRREAGAQAMQVELRALAGLPLPVPLPQYKGRPAPDYPWPWGGYPALPGKPLVEALLAPEVRAALAVPMARFVRALHRMEPVEELPGDLWGRFNFPKRRRQVERYLSRLHAEGLVPRPAGFARIWEEAERTPLPSARVVTHGDLDARHWLVDETGALSGVIDWGDLHRGSAAVDLLAPWIILPPEARPAFWDAYGDADPALRVWSRFRALNQCAVTAAYGADTGHTALLRESLEGLERLRLD